jgi:hypothetical protein
VTETGLVIPPELSLGTLSDVSLERSTLEIMNAVTPP